MIKITKESKQITIIDLVDEYQEENADIKWAIVTDLKESELQLLFGDEIQNYSPYLILSLEQGQAFFSFHKNNEKYKWRYRKKEICGLTDEVVSIYRKDNHDWNQMDDSLRRNIHNEALYRALDTLTGKQRERIIHYYYDLMSEREIASYEGVDQKSVHESIVKGMEKLRKSKILKRLVKDS
jgi:RNA polymerase sigma factor (sigma-70 family)